MSPDGKILATTGDQRVRRWQLSELAPLGETLLAGDILSGAVFSPDGRTLAAAGDRFVTLLAAADGRPVAQLGTADLVQGVVFAPDGRSVTAATREQGLLRWQLSPAAD